MAPEEDGLEAARRRYNPYSDRPNNRIGDTLEALYYVFGLWCVWENGQALTDQEIAAVEMMVPPGCFS